MALPQLTPEQRAVALEKAAAARKDRAEALDRVRAGELTLAGVLKGDAPALLRAFVRQVLTALPGVGPITADKVIADIRIPDKRRISGLSQNQRKALAEHFAFADAH